MGSKMFCHVLAPLALVLIMIGHSLAGFKTGKCHDCASTDSQCPTKECPDFLLQTNQDHGTEFICRTIYIGDKKVKECDPFNLVMEKLLGGLDGKCKEFDSHDDFEKQRHETRYDLTQATPYPFQFSKDHFVNLELSDSRNNPRYLGNNTKVTVCVCDKDSCNNEDSDKKNMAKSGKGSGSVNRVSVIFIFLASAALVPGFHRSQ